MGELEKLNAVRDEYDSESVRQPPRPLLSAVHVLSIANGATAAAVVECRLATEGAAACRWGQLYGSHSRSHSRSRPSL